MFSTQGQHHEWVFSKTFVSRKKFKMTPEGKYLATDITAGRFPAMLIWQIILIIF